MAPRSRRCLRPGPTPMHGPKMAPTRYTLLPDRDAAAIAAPLEAGADPDARDKKFGATPLHFAALKGHGAAVATLIEAGTNPVARTGDGRIPFDLIPEDSPLIGTPVYRRLNDARRK